MNKQNESSAVQQSVNVAMGYKVNSQTGVELEDFGLVSGDALEVMNKEGKTVFQGVRAFLPLNDMMNLVRFADKRWVIVFVNKRKQVKLERVNLKAGEFCLLFDERGKMHYNQVSPYYRDINV